MIVNVKCKKTGDTGKLDIGDLTKAQIEERREKPSQWGYSCSFGHHVELTGNMLTCLEIDWPTLQEGSAPSDASVVDDLKRRFSFVGDRTLTEARFEFLSFGYGAARVREKETGEETCLDYTTLPSGARVYYGNV